MFRSYQEYGGYFFHYTTRQAAFEHIIPDGKLRLSPYSRMRDPLEAKGPDMAAGFSVPPDQQVEEAMQRAYMEARPLIRQHLANTKLLSLTIDAPHVRDPGARPFARGWSRARMWEQYAENHEGVCLVFAKERFEERVLAQLKTRSPDAVAGPVGYTPTGLYGDGAASFTLQPGQDANQLVEAHIRQHGRSLWFTKLQDWESEHEYRFVEPSATDDFSYVEFEDSLLGLVVGHAFPEWQVASLRSICDSADVGVAQVAWEHWNQPMLLKIHKDDPSSG